jgi:hypothetical protein
VVWAVAVVTTWAGGCPNAAPQDLTGLDRGISTWPPGAQCATTPTSHEVFTHQALPWAPWAVTTLIVAAAAVLLIGLLAAIRELRTASGPDASPAVAAELSASDAEWYRQGPPVDAAGGDRRERDPPAIAA